MNSILQPSKQLCVAFLLIVWVLLDVFHIQDQTLVYVIIGLITAITGWHGLSNLPFSVNKAAPPTATRTPQ